MDMDIAVNGTSLQLGPPSKLFHSGPAVGRNRLVASADGQRFLVIAPEGLRDESLTPFVVILNWPCLLDNP
jgi:hypothetical protein